MDTPTNHESFKLIQVKSFIASVNFHRTHLPNLNRIILPLLELANKGNPSKKNITIPKFKWLCIYEETFNKVKMLILNHKANFIPSPEEEYFAESDASATSVGFILYQKRNDVKVPIAALSGTLTQTERSYSAQQRECLAILYGLKSFEIF